jgi:hypothetical protein
MNLTKHGITLPYYEDKSLYNIHCLSLHKIT